MKIDPRWRKVVRDVWHSPTRTILVVISIAVGIVAVGMVTGGYAVISNDLPAQFNSTNPSHIRLSLSPFDDELVDSIRRMTEVEDAAGARRIVARVPLSDGSDQSLSLHVIDDFDAQRIHTVLPEAGQWPPQRMELLVERTSLASLEGAIGEPLTIKLDDESFKTLTIVGTAHDLNEVATLFTGEANGYITFDTLERLGYNRTYNQLLVRVAGDSSDRLRNEEVALAVADKVEKAGVTVNNTFVPQPGEHFMQQFLTPMLLILGTMGVFSLLLSGFLVVNIISALLAQQTRQIGVMKAMGAQGGQVARLYLGMVFLFALLALAVALPLSWLVTRAFTNFAAGLMNFDVFSPPLPMAVILLMVVVGVAVPLGAALIPVRKGTWVTVREAISDFGMGASNFGASRFDRVMEWVLERLRGLSRPTLLSLRNTFRRKGRLMLTLVTLTLASAFFVSVFSVRASLYRTMDDAFDYWNYQASIDFARSYRADYLVETALAMPGVKAAEAWGFRGAVRLRPDGTESDRLLLVAPQAETALLEPTLLEGRWLLPDDENAVVINNDLLADEPDLRVGDTIVLDVAGRESEWTIVGLVRSVLSQPLAYANYPYFAQVVRDVGMASTLNVALEANDRDSQVAMSRALETRFEELGLRVSRVTSTAITQEQVAAQFGVLVTFLAIMALTLAVVGALGLMGTMSINVLERRREIGVMRSIGASTRAVMQIVIVEGVFIGAISWAMGSLVAIWLGRVLSNAVGAGFINSELTWRYSLGGAAFWLLVMALIAAAASVIPARSAAQLTVREVLAYE
jgi:putative ABC transport system permease protein